MVNLTCEHKDELGKDIPILCLDDDTVIMWFAKKAGVASKVVYVQAEVHHRFIVHFQEMIFDDLYNPK